MIDIDPEIAAGLDRLVDDATYGPDWPDVLRRGGVGDRAHRARIRRLIVPAMGLAIGIAVGVAILSHSTRSGSAGAGSCADLAHYRGAEYFGEGVQIAPIAAGSAGTAVLPACTDEPGETTGSQTIHVARIRGVSPRVAFVQIGESDAIFIRSSLASHLPAAIVRLLRAPSCRIADAPIRLGGPWIGILGTNGKTELDMRPPYDVMLLAARATPARYARAYLTVRVPASLGRPLSERDVHDSLGKGGTIAITATCAAGRYVAESIHALPLA